MLHIDGSQGEGGGQMVRSSLALAAATGQPFTITNIRANRSKPGLMRQHAAAVSAVAAVCSARVQGGHAGSSELVFEPGAVRGGTHRVSVGSAGSTLLVLQAVLPVLMFADGPSVVTIEGGTHVAWAPPFDYIERVVAPVLMRLGGRIALTLERPGFYPAGGGRIRVEVEPVGTPRPVALLERGEIRTRRASVLLSGLHRSIGERQLERVREKLGWESDHTCYAQVQAHSAGTMLSLEVGSEGITELFCALGERGKSGELVADEAIEAARAYLAWGVPVGEHLADQLMVPFALAAQRGAACSFATGRLSLHATTNTEIIGRFLPGVCAARETGEGRNVVWSAGVGSGALRAETRAGA